MRHNLTLWVLFAATAVGLLAGCRGNRQRAVEVVGSTSVQPFAEMLSQEFQIRHPDQNIDVQGGGSTAGLQALDSSIAAIGMCSRKLSVEESQRFHAITIARDGLAVVVHPSNPVQGLSLEQIRKIFEGAYTNWAQVGGRAGPIRVIMREEGSGTREAFMKMVMKNAEVSRKALVQESNGAVKALVRGDRGAIGYMSLGLVLIDKEVKAVRVEGVEPTHEAVASGKYPISRPFLFVTKPSAGPLPPEAQAFIDFVLSEEGQAMLEKEGLVRAPREVPSTQSPVPSTQAASDNRQPGTLAAGHWLLGTGYWVPDTLQGTGYRVLGTPSPDGGSR